MFKHSNGNYYGTSRAGGAFGYGTIYRVSAAGEVSVMVHFTGSTGTARGRRPQSGLVADGSGQLWGTTVQGGTGNQGDGYGTVFRFNPVSGSLTTVAEFSGTAGGTKGSLPLAGLCWDGAGFMWGTTSSGGAGAAGTVFKINTANLEFIPVLDFSGMGGPTRGKSPQAKLLYDTTTDLFWGTTTEGGESNLGTVFTLNRSTSAFTTMVEFTGVAGVALGSRPRGGMSFAGGSWWGTTSAGGPGAQGTIFKFTPGGEGFSTVAQFSGTTGAVPGRTPVSTLVLDGAGALWGSTAGGGVGDFGTIFKVATDTGVFSNVMTFTGDGGAFPGAVPTGDLTLEGNGTFCGVTTAGGPSRLGGVYKVKEGVEGYTRIANFVKSLGVANSSNPSTGLVPGPDGLFWGTAEKGGEANAGTIYTVNPGTGETLDVVQFTGMAGNAKGSGPMGELALDTSGNFWGTTVNGGSADMGTVFKINALTKQLVTVAEFTGSNGRNPSARLVLDSNGRVWGTTAEGGAEFSGTAFRLNPATNQLTTVVNFSGIGGSFPGDGPLAGLTDDGQGFLWGTTYEGGDSNLGTIFKISAATGEFTSVISFTGSQGDFLGDGPNAVLVNEGSGFLWGTTGFGGSESAGTVFKINVATGEITTLVEFTGPSGDRVGRNPRGSLISDPLGAWYGTTEGGGAQDLGTIFRVAPDGSFSTIYEFTGSLGSAPGEKPKGSLLLSQDGNFYGTTTAGGTLNNNMPAGNGQIYRLRFGPTPVTLNAIAIESAAATLRATVNPNGTVSAVGFEYSTSPDFANKVVSSAGNSNSEFTPQIVSLDIQGLQPLTQYYFRFRASNPENPNVQYGLVQTFTTSAGEGGTGTPAFVNWLNAAGIAGDRTLAGSDSDGDGTSNAMEFVLGGDPRLNDTVEAPDFYVTAEHLVLTFKRHDRSESAELLLGVEAGPSTDSWPTYVPVGATTALSGSGVTVIENDTGPDTVMVQIPRAGGMKFVRIKAALAP